MNGKTSARTELPGAFAASLLVIGFCALLLWHDPQVFWKDDYQISILPVFADVARSWSEGHLPLLSPYSWACGNLAGEYQYGTFSLFVNAAVVLIWQFPLQFAQQAAALSMAHLFVLGAGAFLLARERKLSTSLAMMVALVAALNGWIICWGASDWFGALAAFAWLPWAWWAMERALNPARSKWRFLWPAPFVYLVLTGGFPYTVLMLALLAAWLALRSLGETRRLSSLRPLSLGCALGVGLSAPAWLALLDYTHGSTRAASFNPAAHWQWLLPPGALPGFVFPGWNAIWRDFSSQPVVRPAIELACGTVPPLALGAGLIFLRLRFVRQIRWELGLLVIVLLLAMLPTAGIFRWSFRWLPLLHLLLALVAAEALAQFRLQSHWNWFLVAIVFVSLLASYLLLPTSIGLPRYDFTSSLTRPEPLDPNRLYLSIYPPPETADTISNHPSPVGQLTRPGSTSMWAGVHLINGYSPIGGAGVARTFACYTHGEIDPAMADYLLSREAGAHGLLATLGIDGIILAHDSASPPPPADEWSLVFSSTEGRVYHRRGGAIPWLRSVPSIDIQPNEQRTIAAIQLGQNSRTRWSAEVKVPPRGPPALLLLSRPYFDGYHAYIGDRSFRVSSYRGLIPTIELPAGTSGRLTIIYRPRWLLWGGAVAVFCAVVWLLSFFCSRRELTARGRAVSKP